MPAGFKEVPVDEHQIIVKSRSEQLSHACCHHEEGQLKVCGSTPCNWVYISLALIALWIISGLFWWLMFEAVVLYDVQMLWAFLGAWLAFMALWGCLLYAGSVEHARKEERDRAELHYAQISRQGGLSDE